MFDWTFQVLVLRYNMDFAPTVINPLDGHQTVSDDVDINREYQNQQVQII